MSETKYRRLNKGEIVQEGDRCDASNDGWRDDPIWVDVPAHRVGKPASDPQYPAHVIYERPIIKE